MSASITKPYKDARARDFDTCVSQREVARNAPFVGTYNTRPDIASLASKKQLTLEARAAKTASWVVTMSMLEEYDVESSCKAGAEQGRFLMSDSHSRSTPTVLTDNEIDDECTSEASVSTTGTASPLNGYKHICKRNKAAMMVPVRSVSTDGDSEEEDDWEQSVTSELEADLTEAAVLMCKSANAYTRKNSETMAPENNHILRSHCSDSGSENSTNLDRFAQKAAEGTVSWSTPHVACSMVGEEVPEEIC